MALAYRTTDRMTDAFLALPLLTGLDAYYPDIVDWFVNKAVPGVVAGRDAMVLAEDAGQVVGVALARAAAPDGASAKLRCVRVLPSHKGRGVAIHLMDRVLRRIDADRPEASVAEELLHDWSRILVNRFGFALDRVEKGLYRAGRLEYLFNAAGRDPRAATPYGAVGADLPADAVRLADLVH